MKASSFVFYQSKVALFGLIALLVAETNLLMRNALFFTPEDSKSFCLSLLFFLGLNFALSQEMSIVV